VLYPHTDVPSALLVRLTASSALCTLDRSMPPTTLLVTRALCSPSIDHACGRASLPAQMGVFAETLRWSCPEERSQRFEYRKGVCESFATIFNQFITDGAVPDCAQFADAAMSVLYKGAGSRGDPANYRGICVPNVLAKLFGLVLGTRLSHWAVNNGVISPAQVGFVVLHGCEYHILTLLETLRHRVRRDQDTAIVFLDFEKRTTTCRRS